MIVSAIKFKFKPWQAIKMARGVAVAGQVLGGFGIAFDVFMQIKEDRDEIKMREAIRENKQNIRGKFSAAANELEDYGIAFVQDNVVSPLDDSIQELDTKIAEIRNTRAGKNELCIEIEKLQRECQNLIREIHST